MAVAVPKTFDPAEADNLEDVRFDTYKKLL
jgi:hypothetical protein